MEGHALGLLYGAIGAGVVALLLKIAEKYWIDIHFGESLEARKKLRIYSKPLWLDCHELQHRLNRIIAKIECSENDQELKPLKLSPKDANSLEWYTKEGYYITSTAYLISSVSCWITLFQRDVVFLQFEERSSTADFFLKIERLKVKITSSPSILWYHYFNGVGELLTEKDTHRPITFASFCFKLHNDKNFKAYYDQLFHFLHQIATDRHATLLQETVDELQSIKDFLEEKNVVPKVVSN